jgi:hypothetical protein
LTNNEHLAMPRRMSGGTLNGKILRILKEKKTICSPLSLIMYNTKPVGHQV